VKFGIPLLFFLLYSCSNLDERSKFESFGIVLPENYLVINKDKKEAIGDSYVEIDILLSADDFELLFSQLDLDKMVLSPQGDYFLFKDPKKRNEYLEISRQKKTITYICIDE
jgi:hypothetical protein